MTLRRDDGDEIRRAEERASEQIKRKRKEEEDYAIVKKFKSGLVQIRAALTISRHF